MAKKAHHNSVTKYALTGLSALGVFAVSTQVANADQVTVKAGDTVWGIAQQHGLTAHGLEAANPTAIKKVNDSVDLIYAGQRLNLSQTQQTANQVQADGTYVVAPGETLSQIAQRFHVSVNSLLAWNHLSSTQLYIGQRLIVNGPATNVFVPAQAAVQPAENPAATGTATTNSAATGTVTSSAPQTTSEVATQPVSAPVQSAAANTSAAESQQVSESASVSQPVQSAVQPTAPVQASATTSTAVAAQSARPVAAQPVQTTVQSSATSQQSTATTPAPASQVQPQSAAGVQSQQSTAVAGSQQSAAVQNSAVTQTVTAAQTDAATTSTAASETVSQAPASSQASQSQAAVAPVSASAATNTPQVQSTAYSQAAAAGSQQSAGVSAVASQSAQTSASSQPQSAAASAASQTNTAVQSASASQQSTQPAATAQNQQAQQSQSSNLQNGSVVSLAVKIANSNSVPYVWGGSSLSGMDCSGLVDYVYANAEGKQLPHNTVALESYVNQHSVSEAQSGDILFWGNHGSTYHCAIYIGNNQFVAAAKPGTNVSVYTISKYFEPSFAGTVK